MNLILWIILYLIIGILVSIGMDYIREQVEEPFELEFFILCIFFWLIVLIMFIFVWSIELYEVQVEKYKRNHIPF